MLYFDDQPVSYCFTIDSPPCRYIIANNYDESVSRYSTGTILYSYVFEDSISQKLTTVNRGLGDSGYKSRWGANTELKLVEWLVLRPNIRGALLHHLLSLKLKFW